MCPLSPTCELDFNPYLFGITLTWHIYALVVLFLICVNHSRYLISQTFVSPIERRLSILCGRFYVHDPFHHDNDVIMGTMASQITSLVIVYSSVYSGADQRKHQSSASLAFMQGIHRLPVNSTNKRPVTRKMFPFDDVITTHKFDLLTSMDVPWTEVSLKDEFYLMSSKYLSWCL